MIVENIHDNARVMMVFFVEPFRAAPEYRVRIGKSVDGTMQMDAFLYVIGKMEEIFTANAVGHEIPDFDKVVIARKVNVCEEIHKKRVSA
jgi:hypothetical protein